MDGKKESLYTDGNSFLINGKSPDKAGTFLVAQSTTHTNQENSALLSFNVAAKF